MIEIAISQSMVYSAILVLAVIAFIFLLVISVLDGLDFQTAVAMFVILFCICIILTSPDYQLQVFNVTMVK